MVAAVTEALPTAELASQSVTNSRGTSGFYTGETTTADGAWEAGWSQTYAADGAPAAPAHHQHDDRVGVR